MTKPAKNLGRLLLGCLILGSLFLLPTTTYFGANSPPPPEGGSGGEWVTTILSMQNDADCEANGCIEWCAFNGVELEPTGRLCCADSTGACIRGTEFYP